MLLFRCIRLVPLVLLACGHAVAQQVEGTLRDPATGDPIAGAVVRLVGANDTVAAISITDAGGGFRLTAPAFGAYLLRAQRLGYGERQSAPFELLARRIYRLDLDLEATPLDLAPVDVVARSRPARRSVFGMDLRAFGGRLLTSEWIASRRAGAASVGTFIRWSNVPGVSVSRGQFGTECVRMARGRLSADQITEPCAMVYVDGVRYRRDRLRDLDPNAVEEILLMRPGEAGVLFGTGSEGGVVIIYTRGNPAR